MADSQPLTWGVTVADVAALAPHIGTTNTQTPADPAFGAGKKITEADILKWIVQVSAEVDLRLRARSALTGDDAQSRIGAAAATVVTNGAGSYFVAAAFPMKAGINDQASYSAELWNRYQSGLAALETVLHEWVDEAAAAPAPVGAGTIVAAFPAARFTDDMVW
ncbi:hypothetical protein ACQCSX_04430 [Pseudarthrobacter sp. P1]|uniref:hypothetical protein n=1 Tax=Pseudarthrobacter sp. P1 TaxID=3418418 RepID=UPI003CE75643